MVVEVNSLSEERACVLPNFEEGARVCAQDGDRAHPTLPRQGGMSVAVGIDAELWVAVVVRSRTCDLLWARWRASDPISTRT